MPADPETEAKVVVANVGGREIDAVDLLERILIKQNWKAVEEGLDTFLLEFFFDKLNLQVTDEELHKHISHVRRQYGLLSGSDTKRWLEEHHLGDDGFLELCVQQLKLNKLKHILFEKRLQETFVYRQLQLAEVEVYKIAVANEEAAKEIVSSVKEGASFFDLARQYSIDQATAKSCGYAGKIKLLKLSPHLQDLLSKSSPGDLIGPLAHSKTFEIYLVENVHRPAFEDVRQELEDELFAEWLAETKARTTVEWLV